MQSEQAYCLKDGNTYGHQFPSFTFISNNAGRSPLVNVVDRALVLRGHTDIEKFDLGFPVLVLEELSLEGCSWENLKFVSICAPKLFGLIIFEDGSELSSASDGCQITVVLNNAAQLLAQVPLFNDVTTLALEIAPVDIGSQVLLTMLQYFPRLQTLIFHEGIKPSSNNLEDDGVLEPLPPCFLSHLKTFKVNQFWGSSNELDALKV
ncbi:hypothetical protein C1H46_021050 [Malus baccata]|uniref:FBD domain-containing protein n=1 Tax=Malus baccata TaxID=106549 RepID=A0A540M3R3_MALBA|nr:hypothetical protein C1H46_021050 [Malus baccata]